MEEMAEQIDPKFQFDLEGRIRNLSLPASSTNALIPLFEAVSNSIHAIEARFGEATSARSGRIEIAIVRGKDEEAHVVGFVVRDNGIGMTDDNMRSFCTSDSKYKVAKGGKGIGRLSWLKAFQRCAVISNFENGGGVSERKFDFGLNDGADPIHNHKVVLVTKVAEPGTEISLGPYYTPYEVRCPKKATTIAQKLVGHFLPYLVVERLPALTLIDVDSSSIDVREYFNEHQKRNQVAIERLKPNLIEPEREFNFYHVLLKKELRFLEGGGNHWMFYAGNSRVARYEPIDGQLGLKYVGEDSDCVYVGLVVSDYLDSHVNQERTGFSFAEEDFAVIHKAAVESAKVFLSEYIDRVRLLQIETTDRIIRENPQFIGVRKDIEGFASKLSLSTQREEDILLELSRDRYRSKRRLEGEIRTIKASDGSKTTNTEDLNRRVKEVTEALNAGKLGSLAEYVVRRKEILDLFDSSLAFKDSETRKYFREEMIHNLICPVRSSSDELEYDDHNLWVLDDRLAFYTFFQSDKPFSTFVEGSESGREPDLAIMFERALAFQREGRDEPIVIIEFKRPGRDDYDPNSSPVVQVLSYVDEFHGGKTITDFRGRVIKQVDLSTRFICYVVADFTESLKKVVRSSPANNPSADGEGFFGYSGPHNAFIEVIPYAKVLRDARIRNEAFFRRLDLI